MSVQNAPHVDTCAAETATLHNSNFRTVEISRTPGRSHAAAPSAQDKVVEVVAGAVVGACRGRAAEHPALEPSVSDRAATRGDVRRYGRDAASESHPSRAAKTGF
eukprot:SAG31_NODE_1513_length_8045_cov_5.748804_3_plen_105_part_00